MQSGTALILLGITATAVYSVWRQNGPSTGAPVAVMTSLPTVTAQATVPAPNVSSSPIPPTKADLADKPAPPDRKTKVEALTAAAIAAIIVQSSRDQYHKTGKPCACPDDRMRNGRVCGATSAYSRPGGAAPLCYPTDVPMAMIKSYRQKMVPH